MNIKAGNEQRICDLQDVWERLRFSNDGLPTVSRMRTDSMTSRPSTSNVRGLVDVHCTPASRPGHVRLLLLLRTRTGLWAAVPACPRMCLLPRTHQIPGQRCRRAGDGSLTHVGVPPSSQRQLDTPSLPVSTSGARRSCLGRVTDTGSRGHSLGTAEASEDFHRLHDVGNPQSSSQQTQCVAEHRFTAGDYCQGKTLSAAQSYAPQKLVDLVPELKNIFAIGTRCKLAYGCFRTGAVDV
jgi:hypothetical protein